MMVTAMIAPTTTPTAMPTRAPKSEVECSMGSPTRAAFGVSLMGVVLLGPLRSTRGVLGRSQSDGGEHALELVRARVRDTREARGRDGDELAPRGERDLVLEHLGLSVAEGRADRERP